MHLRINAIRVGGLAPCITLPPNGLTGAARRAQIKALYNSVCGTRPLLELRLLGSSPRLWRLTLRAELMGVARIKFGMLLWCCRVQGAKPRTIAGRAHQVCGTLSLLTFALAWLGLDVNAHAAVPRSSEPRGHTA